jgi:hypothetical protein
LKKALLSLLGALLLLGLVFWFTNHREKAAARPRHAFTLGPDEVVRLRVDYLGDSATLIRTGRGWLTAADSFPADTARLRRVLGHLLALQNRETVSDSADAAALAEYGLDSATVKRVEWELADGRVIRVRLGKISGIDFGSTFWKPAADPAVYRTPGTFIWQVSSRVRDWKDTNLYAGFSERDVRSVEVAWRTPDSVRHAYRLERDSGKGDTAFRLAKPFAAPALRAPAAKIFRHAAQFKIDEFPPGVDSSAAFAALDHPVMTLRIVLQDGSARTVEAGAEVDAYYRYVRHSWHKAPVRVFRWRFDYFAKTPGDFVEAPGTKRD